MKTIMGDEGAPACYKLLNVSFIKYANKKLII